MASSFLARLPWRLGYALGFFLILWRFTLLSASGQGHETDDQKFMAIRAAGLVQSGVVRDPPGADRECAGPTHACPNDLHCFHINFQYQDGSPAFNTYRCENSSCLGDFIHLMISGHTDKTSGELINSLRESANPELNLNLTCPAVNLWDPQSPNFNRRNR